jgi:hypothetical protein
VNSCSNCGASPNRVTAEEPVSSLLALEFPRCD